MTLALGALARPVAALPIPGRPFWPYFAGAVILIIGLVRIGRATAQARGIDGVITLGRVFFAVPMAVFGADHFIAPRFVATLVPSWILPMLPR